MSPRHPAGRCMSVGQQPGKPGGTARRMMPAEQPHSHATSTQQLITETITSSMMQVFTDQQPQPDKPRINPTFHLHKVTCNK